MKPRSLSAALLLLCGLPLPAGAASLICEGVLGNSGEQGKTLVRFGRPDAPGLGVVCDETGSLWDRGGEGVLNRYAVDGRLLASYKIPPARGEADQITRVGNLIVLDLGGKLYSLPLDAAPGTEAKPLSESADRISFGSADGSIAVAMAGADRKSWTVSLFNPATRKSTPSPIAPVEGFQDMDLLPDGTLAIQSGNHIALFREGKRTEENRPSPGERIQFLDGFWYGSAWHGTLRRFNSELEATPGVVLGGGTGSFIGHVDGNAELEKSRGLARVGGDLFAASGFQGAIHLLQWSEEAQHFTIVARIGAMPSCVGLGLNGQGQVWFHGGHWEWTDRPEAPLRDCSSGMPDWDSPGIGPATTLPSGKLAAFMIRGHRPGLTTGPFSWNLAFDPLPGVPGGYFPVAVTAYGSGSALTFLAIDASGKGRAWPVDAAGRVRGDGESITLETASPVREWTSLTPGAAGTLLGSGDGYVIELAKDGANWKESRRWNSWNGAEPSSFGTRIHLASDAGLLWVTDARRNRVLCFPLGGSGAVPPSVFGIADTAGSDLAHLDTPETVAARDSHAVVFDGGNQRLVKLTLSP